MDLIFCAAVVGTVLFFWYRKPKIKKPKIIELTPYMLRTPIAHKSTQTNYSPMLSPTSSISSLDFTDLPFVLDEEYLERGSERISNAKGE